MDWSQFFDVSVQGIPLLLVVLGLVEFVKQLGVSGKWLLGSSMAIGAVLGVGYQVSVATAMPVNFGGWFAVLLYGLGLGLFASKVYDAIQSAAAKAIAK